VFDRIRDPWLRALSILLVCIAGLYLAGMVWALLVHLADILVLFFAAWLLAFMLEPFVSLLAARYKLPRGLAVAGVYGALLGALVAVGIWLVPALLNQLVAMALQWPVYVENVGYYIAFWQGELAARGINPPPELWGNYQELLQRLAGLSGPLLTNALALARGAAALAIDAVIVLVLSVYLVLDADRLTRAALAATPAHLRDDVSYFMESVRLAFGGFLRGQLLLAVVYGLGTAAVMAAAGLDYVLVASVFAGAAMLIPFIGQVLALVPPLGIALLLQPARLWWVLLLLVGLQLFLINVVSPRVMSQTVGIHPLLVLVAVLVGGKLAGVWGAVFGVPIAGVLVAMVAFYRFTLEERRQRAAQLPGAALDERHEDAHAA
jgi:predicted PurR-regulated permease PerM